MIARHVLSIILILTGMTAAIAQRLDQHYLVNGGVPKDGIPALDHPEFVAAEQAQLANTDRVTGLVIHGKAKAYPHNILNYHEIVNDTVGGKPVAVTYCPLCHTNPVYSRQVNNKVLSFGVSGNLYNSCLVMYDRATNSYWHQPWGVAVSGPRKNQQLTQIAAVTTTWQAWHRQHPDTRVLSRHTGYQRPYDRDPYRQYESRGKVMFPIRGGRQYQQPLKPIYIIKQPEHHHPHAVYGGTSTAVSQQTLRKHSPVELQLNGKRIKAVYDNELQTYRFYDQQGEPLPSMTAWRFVYPANFASPVNE